MATLQEHLNAFLDRIDKELARAAKLDTAAIGGLTKLGAALELVLKAAYREAASKQRPPRLLPNPLPTGPGQWLKAMRNLTVSADAEPVLKALFQDAFLHDASKLGNLEKLVRLRNEIAHQAIVSSPEMARRLLFDVKKWLSPFRRS